MAFVYIWDINPFKLNFSGHAGCSIGNKYIGLHPKGKMRNFEADKKKMGYAPKHVIKLTMPYHIEETVAEIWEHDKLSVPYEVDKNNCASMVSTALILCTYMYVASNGGSPTIISSGSLLKDITTHYLKLKACGWNEGIVAATGAPHAEMKKIAAFWTPYDVECLTFRLKKDVFRYM